MSNMLDLGELVRIRQSLISQGTLRQALDDLRTVHPQSEADPQFTFLETVLRYSYAVKANTNDAIIWIDLLSAFSVVDPITPELEFYLPNYMLLCARNAGPPNDAKVPGLFQRAAEAALKLPDGERDEALGHLNYNVAKWLKKRGQVADALAHWQAAARHRFQFYGRLKMAKAPRAELLAAAQQLAKLRKDFPDFFVGTDPEECGVDPDVFAELEADFGQELHAFSAKP